MGVLNYKAYAKAIERGMPRSNMSQETMQLFKFITEDGSVYNKNGEPYNLDNRTAIEWYRGETDIPLNIKAAAHNERIRKNAPIHFEKCVFPKLKISTKEADIYPVLLDLIDRDHMMAVETKKHLKSLHLEGKKYHFLAETFLYAITTDNCAVESVPTTLGDEIAKLKSLLEMFQKPKALDPPEEIAQQELIYVQALLAAYAEASGLSTLQKEELSSYPKYQRNFDRQRKDYYAAEAIRESTRDAQFLQGRDDFSDLKEETFSAIVDVYDRTYTNGYERLQSVLEHVTAVQLVSLLATIPNWIGPSERKGVCHMLVNDGRLRWVENETV